MEIQTQSRFIQGECRICRTPLRLRVDNEYAELGHDPMNLLKVVVCNRCADNHTRERRISDAIFNVCFTLCRKTTQEQRVTLRCALETLTRKYAEVIALIQDNDTIIWDNEFPQTLFEHPAECPRILRKYRRDCARIPRTQRFPVEAAVSVGPPEPAASLPYKDA